MMMSMMMVMSIVNLLVPMSGGKMERGVVAHICCVHACSSTHLVMVMVDWW